MGDRDQINGSYGGSQSLTQDDIQATAGGFGYAGLPFFYVQSGGEPVSVKGQPVTVGGNSMAELSQYSDLSIQNRAAQNLRKWTVARGKALTNTNGGVPAKINLIGDSTQGIVGSGGGTNGANGGFPVGLAAQLVKLLNSMAGRADFARCDGWWGNHFSTASNLAQFLLYDTRWTAPGWADSTVRYAGGSMQSPAANTQPITLTGIAVPYDRVRIVYTQAPNCGTLTVASASGGSQAVATAGSNSTQEATITLTRGTGNLTLTPAASTAGIYLLAIEIWDSTVGQVIVRDMGFPGSTSSSYLKSTTVGATMAADFMNLSFGLNNAAAGGSADSLVADLATFIANYTPSGSDSLTVQNESSSGWQSIAGILDNQRAYAAAIRAMGLANGYPVVDLPVRWGDYPTANGNLMMYNDPHPNSAGYADKAVALMSILWA